MRGLSAGDYKTLVLEDGVPVQPGIFVGNSRYYNPRVQRKPTFDEARVHVPADGAAIDILENSASLLAASLGVHVYQEVAAAAHEFDYDGALAALPCSST